LRLKPGKKGDGRTDGRFPLVKRVLFHVVETSKKTFEKAKKEGWEKSSGALRGGRLWGNAGGALERRQKSI